MENSTKEMSKKRLRRKAEKARRKAAEAEKLLAEFDEKKSPRGSCHETVVRKGSKSTCLSSSRSYASTDSRVNIGTSICKFFLGPNDFYHGRVVGFDSVEAWYNIKYSDGDEEEMSYKELMPCITLCNAFERTKPGELFRGKHGCYYCTANTETPEEIAEKFGCHVDRIINDTTNQTWWGPDLKKGFRINPKTFIAINPKKCSNIGGAPNIFEEDECDTPISPPSGNLPGVLDTDRSKLVRRKVKLTRSSNNQLKKKQKITSTPAAPVVDVGYRAQAQMYSPENPLFGADNSVVAESTIKFEENSGTNTGRLITGTHKTSPTSNTPDDVGAKEKTQTSCPNNSNFIADAKLKEVETNLELEEVVARKNLKMLEMRKNAEIVNPNLTTVELNQMFPLSFVKDGVVVRLG